MFYMVIVHVLVLINVCELWVKRRMGWADVRIGHNRKGLDYVIESNADIHAEVYRKSFLMLL